MSVLKGIRVVEFTHMVAGPACGQVLGDLGADVIKVEPPDGDITRRLGPGDGEVSALFATTNRNKRSVRLDLRDEGDAEKARALALDADVVVTNVDRSMLEKAGLSPADLRDRNPGLIVVEISAFGPGGALGTDGIAQAAMGLMSVTGAPDGATYRTGASVVDVSTGVWAALGVLAALERRRQTGRGDYLATSLADVCLYMQYSQLGMFAAEPGLVRRNGNHSMVSCTPVFEAADGRIIVTILHDRHWETLCALLGRRDVQARPELSSNDARCLRQTEIEQLLNPDFTRMSRAAWTEILRQKRIPCGPERTYAEVLADDDLRRRGMLHDLQGLAGSSLQVKMPVSFLEHELPSARPAPALGDADADAALPSRRTMSADEPRFGLSARERSLHDAAEAIASKVISGDAPLMRQELLALFAELRPLGYLGSVLPSEHSPGPLGFAALVEGLSPALALLGNHSVQRYLDAYGTDAQKQRYLLPLLDAASIAAIAITEPQAGADLSRLATTAERSGGTFVLRGRKTWVTHGLTADVFIVLAQTADGPTRFIVPGDTQGLKRIALDVVGLKHLTFAELQFDACTISEDHVFGAVGKGLEGTKAAFPIARALAALQALRLGEAALDIAREYARDRNLFGRSLADSAIVQDRHADQAAKLAGARLLAYQAMTGLDAADCAVTAAQAKALACGSALDACLWAIELSGSAALSTNTTLEKLLRDARMMAVVDGTVALNRFVAARRLLRRE